MSIANDLARQALSALTVVARRVRQGAPMRLDMVPAALQDRADPPGFAGVRYRFPTGLARLQQDAIEAIAREQAHRAGNGQAGPLPPAAYLAISGGGDKGAFATGVLSGWTELGTRPQFKVVTGVSTGALIAPLAFLGSAHDGPLRKIYTGVTAADIATPRGGLAALFDDALSDNAPLWRLVRDNITAAVLGEIAAEYAKGRMLLVGTTDLDARQGVIWNMTKIAATKHPQAMQLFHSVLIGSAAIPAAFPPMLFDVEVDGRRYQEMHVDGGASGQVFFTPPALLMAEEARALGVERERKLYVIRNSQPEAERLQVDRRVMAIATRAIAALIDTQGRGDLYRLYFVAQRDGIDFNVAFIPPSFAAPHREEFDTEYMRQLFELGRRMILRGEAWQKHPPDYAVGDAAS